MTKKAFENLLNSIYGIDYTRQGSTGQLGAKVRPWGTWLRSADREHFDGMYVHFLATGTLLGDEERTID